MFHEVQEILCSGFRQCVGSPQNDFYLQRKNVNTCETYQVARSAFLKRLNSTGVYSVPTPWTVPQLSMLRLDSSTERRSFLTPRVSIPHPQELVHIKFAFWRNRNKIHSIHSVRFICSTTLIWNFVSLFVFNFLKVMSRELCNLLLHVCLWKKNRHYYYIDNCASHL
jgi:hypothetical protein